MAESEEQAARWDLWASHDDRVFATADPRPAGMFLAKIAAGGHALELGAATGRVAVALAEQGVPVTALDISPEMIRRIEDARGSLPVTARVGDMAEVPVDGAFSLVYATLSTFFGLLTQERQIECFTNVARVLAPDGKFVIEAFVPLRQGIVTRGQQLAIRAMAPGCVDLSATLHDAANQRITFQEIRVDADGLRMLPIEIRYVWPSELDLMARLAGMSLHARYGDWDCGAFSSASLRHISLYETI